MLDTNYRFQPRGETQRNSETHFSDRGVLRGSTPNLPDRIGTADRASLLMPMAIQRCLQAILLGELETQGAIIDRFELMLGAKKHLAER